MSNYWNNIPESIRMNLTDGLYFAIGRLSGLNHTANLFSLSSSSLFNEIWKESLAFVKVDDSAYLTEKRIWTANTSPVEGLAYFTSSNTIHVCYSNNNGSLSLQEPSSQGVNPEITSADGMVWRYICSVSPSDSVKFETNQLVPIKLDPITGNDPSIRHGQISYIRVVDGGSYLNDTPSNVIISGNGTGFLGNANFTFDSNSNTFAISSISILSRGEGYSEVSNVMTLASPVVSSAVLEPVFEPYGGVPRSPALLLDSKKIALFSEIEGSANIFSYPNVWVSESNATAYSLVALVRDPYDTVLESKARGPVYNNTIVIDTTGANVNPSGISDLEEITQGNVKMKVVSRFTSSNLIFAALLSGASKELNQTDDIIYESNSVTAISGSFSITPPRLLFGSGVLVGFALIDHPVERNINQTDYLRAIINVS